MRTGRLTYECLILMVSIVMIQAQETPRSIPKAPDRSEGMGPYPGLILRGVTLIDGSGSPPIGPVDIVIKNNRIEHIKSVGNPGLPINEEVRPKAETGFHELDLDGHYVLPGFVDMHAHIGGQAQGGNGLDWVLEQKQRSANNEITAPRIEAYVWFGQGAEEPISTAEQAAQWASEAAARGADGFKLSSYRPDIMKAIIDQAKKDGIGTAAHLAQLRVAWMNTIKAARLGLTTQEHWYGLPESLFTDRTIQDFRLDYNYNNEQHRFGEAGRLWKQAAPRGSDQWNSLIGELLELDFTFVPTLTIYEASRDLMRARTAEWHETYALPSLWEFYRPNRRSHGSYWFYWTTEDEVAWKQNYRIWMSFLNDYKNRGGRVATGSDSGFMYKLYGFGYIRELELLQEAGFHPLEVIRSATLAGSEALGRSHEIGTVEAGKLADLVVVAENPLQNLKVLYGTGAIQVNEKNQPVRVGGVRYTIKDGIVYDAKKLLSDVARIVREAKQEAGTEIVQPGLAPVVERN